MGSDSCVVMFVCCCSGSDSCVVMFVCCCSVLCVLLLAVLCDLALLCGGSVHVYAVLVMEICCYS